MLLARIRILLANQAYLRAVEIPRLFGGSYFRVLLTTAFFVLLYCFLYKTLGDVFDPHQVLGLAAGASPAAIKKAYKLAVLQYHPDKLQPGEQPDATRFHEVQEAYDLLSALHKRRRRPERSDEE